MAGTGECGIADQLFCVYTLGNGPAISEAIDSIYSLAVDTSGNVYFAEPINDRIRMIAATTTSTYTQGDVYTLSIGGELFTPKASRWTHPIISTLLMLETSTRSILGVAS